MLGAAAPERRREVRIAEDQRAPPRPRRRSAPQPRARSGVSISAWTGADARAAASTSAGDSTFGTTIVNPLEPERGAHRQSSTCAADPGGVDPHRHAPLGPLAARERPRDLLPRPRLRLGRHGVLEVEDDLVRARLTRLGMHPGLVARDDETRAANGQRLNS